MSFHYYVAKCNLGKVKIEVSAGQRPVHFAGAPVFLQLTCCCQFISHLFACRRLCFPSCHGFAPCLAHFTCDFTSMPSIHVPLASYKYSVQVTYYTKSELSIMFVLHLDIQGIHRLTNKVDESLVKTSGSM